MIEDDLRKSTRSENLQSSEDNNPAILSLQADYLKNSPFERHSKTLKTCTQSHYLNSLEKSSYNLEYNYQNPSPERNDTYKLPYVKLNEMCNENNKSFPKLQNNNNLIILTSENDSQSLQNSSEISSTQEDLIDVVEEVILSSEIIEIDDEISDDLEDKNKVTDEICIIKENICKNKNIIMNETSINEIEDKVLLKTRIMNVLQKIREEQTDKKNSEFNNESIMTTSNNNSNSSSLHIIDSIVGISRINRNVPTMTTDTNTENCSKYQKCDVENKTSPINNKNLPIDVDNNQKKTCLKKLNEEDTSSVQELRRELICADVCREMDYNKSSTSEIKNKEQMSDKMDTTIDLRKKIEPW